MAVPGPTSAELDASLAVEELYSKYRKLQQQLEFLEVQVRTELIWSRVITRLKGRIYRSIWNVVFTYQEEYIKDEQRNLKKEYLHAQEEVKRIQSVPLVIGKTEFESQPFVQLEMRLCKSSKLKIWCFNELKVDWIWTFFGLNIDFSIHRPILGSRRSEHRHRGLHDGVELLRQDPLYPGSRAPQAVGIGRTSQTLQCFGQFEILCLKKYL